MVTNRVCKGGGGGATHSGSGHGGNTHSRLGLGEGVLSEIPAIIIFNGREGGTLKNL